VGDRDRDNQTDAHQRTIAALRAELDALRTGRGAAPGTHGDSDALRTGQGAAPGTRDALDARRMGPGEPKGTVDELRAAILEAALDCIVTIDRDGRVVEWNPAAERTFGYSRDQAVGQDIAQLIIPPEHRENHYRGMARFLATGDGPVIRRRIELEALRADGFRFPVELAISPLPIGGEPHFTAYLRDISDQKLWEVKLREREQRLQATYESAFAGIAEVDVAGRFLRVNEEFCSITGYSREELQRLTFRDITPLEDLWKDLEQFDRQMAGDIATYRLEKRFAHKGGHSVWVDLSASRVDDEEGRPVYGVRVVRDITERKRAEEQIRFQAYLLDSVQEAVVATDLQGHIVFWNRFAEHLFGWTADEALGRHVLDLTSASDRSKAEATMALLARGGSWSGEFIGRRRGGATFPGHVTNAPVHDETGAFIGIVGVSYDMTPRKDWEERQKLLINELNHRVKNTLATVQSIVSQTLRNAQSFDRAREDLEVRLLALSRTHDVLTRESWERADLRDIVDVATEPYRSRGEHRFRVEGSPVTLPPALALTIAMALQELATNAVKYGALSNEAGTIDLTWRVSRATPPVLDLEWRETGGPPVAAPTRKGFGTRLIERSLAAETGGEASLAYDPAGLVCRIRAPLPA
jgi:PAS domain S-box-containing protein